MIIYVFLYIYTVTPISFESYVTFWVIYTIVLEWMSDT